MARFKIELVVPMKTTIEVTMSDEQAEDAQRRSEILLREMMDLPKRKLPSGVWNAPRSDRKVVRLWRTQ